MRQAVIFYKGKPYIYPDIEGFEIEADNGEEMLIECKEIDGRRVYQFGKKLYEDE